MLQVGVLIVHSSVVLLLQIALVHHDMLCPVAMRDLVLHRVDGVSLARHIRRSLILLNLTLSNNVARPKVIFDLLLLGQSHVTVLIDLLLAWLVVEFALLVDI